MKRPRDMFDTPVSSPPIPSKRRFLSQSMAPSSSPSTSRSTPYTLPRQPSCSPWALATPHDSPSNPFGLNRSLRALTLPRPSGFGKHIVLRLQLVSTVDAPRTRSGPSRRFTEAPFRIVQLPLNFSFRLLHMLILFVFASDARLLAKRKRRVFSPPSPIGRKNKGKTRSKKGDKDKAQDEDEDDDDEGNEEGHLFEVLNDISVCSMAGMRPGHIREGTGKLYARLSSARERKLFTDPDDEDDEGDVFAGTSVKHTTPLAEVEKDAEEGWVWEAEDDFMLSNVWSDGLDLKKGIIYHHTPSTLIHITVNQARVPGRKGTGNTPYVFVAQGGTNGAVCISNVASGPIPPSDDEKENNATARRKKGKRNTRSTKGRDRNRDRLDELPEEDLEEVSDLTEEEEANDDQRERWNAGDAFQRFLKREAARERAMRRHPNLVAPPSPIPPSKSARANNILGPPSSSPLPHGKLRSQAQSKHPYRYANANAASSAASLALSSPSTLPIIHPSSDFDGDLSGWSDYLPESGDEETKHQRARYSIELPLQTPFPAHPAARRRIGRVCMRLERQTSRGLSELSDSEEEEADGEGEEEGERGRRAEKAARRGGSPSEDATARRAAVDSNPKPPIPVVRVSAPAPAPPPAPAPAPIPVPPVVAVEGPNVFERGREDHSDREEGGDTEEDESAPEEGERNSDDEGWEIGSVWGLGPVPPDWDSEEEV